MEEPAEKTAGCSARRADHRPASRMSDNRPAHGTGSRPNRATRRRTPGDLAAFPLARRRSSLFGHRCTVLDILLRRRRPDLA